MLRRNHLALLPLLCIMMGCDNDSSGPTDDDAGTLDDASIADVRIGRADASPNLDGALPEDVSVVDDGVADAEPADDMAVPLTIESCEEGCARVSQCGRDDIFGGPDSCQDACAHAARDGSPTSWFDCLEVESCNLLHLCRLPAPRSDMRAGLSGYRRVRRRIGVRKLP